MAKVGIGIDCISLSIAGYVLGRPWSIMTPGKEPACEFARNHCEHARVVWIFGLKSKRKNHSDKRIKPIIL
jgi:hypothetical protein